MSRSGKLKRRKIKPESVYQSELVHKFINKIMMDGKKSLAERIVYQSLKEAAAKLQKEPMEVFKTALKNSAPFMEVKARRVGGATYQVPIEVDPERARRLAMRWLRDAARRRKGKSMIENLSAEIIDACNHVGGAVKSCETMHKTAEANKAFAHFRW